MCAENSLYAFWKQFDGRKVVIDGLDCIVRVSSHRAIYPYEHMTCDVRAEPTGDAKLTAFYKGMKAKLGDDWSTDLLRSDCDEVLAQLG